MNASEEQNARELSQRLAEAEATIQALLSGQIDAVVDPTNGTPVLLAKAQQALKESEERFREQAALLDIAHDAIYVRNLDGHITYWNKGAERIYGWTAAEAIGRRAAELLCKEPSEFLAAEAAVLLNGAWQGEMARRTRTDRDIIAAVRWTLVLDAQGHPKSILAINQDITSQRALEAQFNQAQKMEAIGQLAGGVAHDFNNLLTVILGFCELLLAERPADDPGRADIVEIQKAGILAASLTRQLLSFSRKEIITPTRLDLNVVAADMQPMLSRLIGEHVTTVLDLRPGLAPVKADRGQVEQVILNLAVNARDAMPNGGTLTIATANAELDEQAAATHGVTPGSYVALIISDSGAGMTAQVQAHLFEPFFTTKEKGKGTGLGLATVHSIVTRCRGSVAVASEVGRGTSFTVFLPQEHAAEPVVDEPGPVARPRSGGKTILLVEDADGLRALVEKVLQRQGYTVRTAANAAEAIRLFEQDPAIDVLLTDVVMPGGSGQELTAELTRRDPTLKVVYMSGFTDDAIVRHGVLEPGVIFLQKPFTSAALAGKIREALDT